MSELNKHRNQTYHNVEYIENKDVSMICVPSYKKFKLMTINRTTSMDDLRYTTIFRDLEAAKRQCTVMQTDCHAIVEQVKDRFTLRTTGFVQENDLRYKYVSKRDL